MRTGECGSCSAPIEIQPRGRTRKYCSTACRSRAKRAGKPHGPELPPGTAFCRGCSTLKPLSAFYLRKSGGRRKAACKQCLTTQGMREANVNQVLCKFPECVRPSAAHGHCRSHRKQEIKEVPLRPLKRRRERFCVECGAPEWKNALCPGHYKEKYPNHAQPPRGWAGWPVEDRIKFFMGEPDENGCMRWNGNIRKVDGYGSITVDNKSKLAHRVVCEIFSEGDLDPSDMVHHACANRWCVNPDHLQAVRPHENVAEMHERNFYKAKIAKLEAENAALRNRISELESERSGERVA